MSLLRGTNTLALPSSSSHTEQGETYTPDTTPPPPTSLVSFTRICTSSSEFLHCFRQLSSEHVLSGVEIKIDLL